MSASQRRPSATVLRDNARGFSLLVASLMTIVVLLVLGIFMVVMAVSMVPTGGPATGMLSGTEQSPNNYTVTVIALTSQSIRRDQVQVHVLPVSNALKVSNISGSGQFLSPGDSFTVANLHPDSSYVVRIEYKATGSVIASTTLYNT